MHHSSTSDRCNIGWDIPQIVSCSAMQINVSLMIQNGTAVYSDSFGPNITSTQTTPMNLDAVYTAAVTAQNECGSATCATSCSAGKRLRIALFIYIYILCLRIDSTE